MVVWQLILQQSALTALHGIPTSSASCTTNSYLTTCTTTTTIWNFPFLYRLPPFGLCGSKHQSSRQWHQQPKPDATGYLCSRDVPLSTSKGEQHHHSSSRWLFPVDLPTTLVPKRPLISATLMMRQRTLSCAELLFGLVQLCECSFLKLLVR